MRLKFGETEIRISGTILIMPVLMLIAGLFGEYAVIFLSMLLHELSHIAAARLYGIKTDLFSASAIGFSAAIQIGSCSKKELIFIYSAGPAFNLLVYFAALILDNILLGDQSPIGLVSTSNLLLGLFNLLPVLPLDGGRLMLELLSGAIGAKAAGRTIRRLAWLISAVMILLGLYQMYRTTFNISLVIIGVYIMIAIKTSGLESAVMSIREIIYRRSRLIKRGIYPARDLVAMKDTLLREALRCMDFDRFHIVYVLDDELHMIGTYTENEIIDALTAHNDEITFGQLIEVAGSRCAKT